LLPFYAGNMSRRVL